MSKRSIDRATLHHRNRTNSETSASPWDSDRRGRPSGLLAASSARRGEDAARTCAVMCCLGVSAVFANASADTATTEEEGGDWLQEPRTHAPRTRSLGVPPRQL
jgi:hypothetical protein